MSRLTSFPRHLLLSLLAAAALAACGGDDDNTPVATPPAEATPKTLQLEKVGESPRVL